jgi:PhzF family phenazine biosynthesis protein
VPLPLYWIDAFADRPFAGNPAAVVPLETWLPDALMQQIAFENGLSETAFFVRTAKTRYELRWFTPATEVDLCGHATLAAAFVVFREPGDSADAITFDSRSGPLIVRRRDDLLELDFPARPASPAPPSPELAHALGRAPRETLRAERAWLCVYDDEAAVRALRPDFAALGRIKPGRMIVTAPGLDVDFVSRFFAPDAGIDEDPVTGSSHCTLAPFWAERLRKSRLLARQVSRRGGDLRCEIAGDRVHLAGKAVLYLKGEIRLPSAL